MATSVDDKSVENKDNTTLSNFPPSKLDSNIVEVLFTENMIRQRCIELGEQISKEYEGKELVIVGLLRGAFIFLADLSRCITIPHQVDFLMLSSYHGTKSTNVKISKDMQIDPYNKHILIVEDLIDTGATLQWLRGHLQSKQCTSVKLCCLFDKQTERRKTDFLIDYVGWKCPDKWIVGYGMDYDQYYRSLPYVGVLDPKIYQKTTETEQKDE